MPTIAPLPFWPRPLNPLPAGIPHRVAEVVPEQFSPLATPGSLHVRGTLGPAGGFGSVVDAERAAREATADATTSAVVLQAGGRFHAAPVAFVARGAHPGQVAPFPLPERGEAGVAQAHEAVRMLVQGELTSLPRP